MNEKPFLSPAKLNLFLHITGRREDGYHNLQTLFQFIDYCDTLYFSNYSGHGPIELENNIPGVPPEQNLISKAAHALQAATNCTMGARIRLAKQLPMGGGIGGGSSNAATTLVALNQLWDTGLNEDELAALRQEEQTAAALAVGVQDLHWLNYPDGRVVNSLDLRRDISRVIRIVQPDVVVTQPTEANWDRIYGSHPDHLATAWATMAAVYPDARNPRSHPELLAEGHQPHTVKQVWMMWMAAPQGTMLHVDITATFEEKVKALRCHSSQTDRIEGLDDLLREWASGVAATADMPPDTLAEGFRVIDTE